MSNESIQLSDDHDDIVNEYQMEDESEPEPWVPGPPNQVFINQELERQARHPRKSTHSKWGTPVARPWDEQDDADILARQKANESRINGIAILACTAVLSHEVALSVLS